MSLTPLAKQGWACQTSVVHGSLDGGRHGHQTLVFLLFSVLFKFHHLPFPLFFFFFFFSITQIISGQQRKFRKFSQGKNKNCP